MSVNAVDQTTGNTTPLAGNTNNLVGNLSALTTNTKSDAVGAINEVNQTKQNATDNNLQTTDKTIVGGINELRSGLTNKAHVPSSSDSSLGTVTAGNSENFTAANDGYIAIYCGSGSSQKTFSAIIRDNSILRYGTFVSATLAAYNSEAIGGLFVKKGRNYSVRNVGENDFDVYFCT